MKKYIAFLFCMLGGVTMSQTSTVEINEFSFLLKPSTIESAGIGVFATHDMPVGTIIYFSQKNYPHRVLKKSDIPEDFLHFCIAVTEEEWLCPDDFSKMGFGWFINHSFTPNIKKVELGSAHVIRAIKKGDEILLNYNDLDEPESVKEDYYKKTK